MAGWLLIQSNVFTLPAGANSAGDTIKDNTDEQSFQNGWPASRSTGFEAKKWHHSDFDYVAYPFTYNLYDEIVNNENLNQL